MEGLAPTLIGESEARGDGGRATPRSLNMGPKPRACEGATCVGCGKFGYVAAGDLVGCTDELGWLFCCSRSCLDTYAARYAGPQLRAVV